MNRAERRRRTAIIVRRKIEFVSLIWEDGVAPEDETYVRGFIGRCKKIHPYDCGKTRCGVCSGNKRFRAGPTLQEKLAELTYQEQFNELRSKHMDDCNPNKIISDCEQSAQLVNDIYPNMLWSFYSRCKTERFNEDQSFKLAITYLREIMQAASCGQPDQNE